MLAADFTTPCTTTAGTVMPTGTPSAAPLPTSSATTSATSWGWPPDGVSTRVRSAANSPVARSTGAPLMPLPPKSMPKGRVARSAAMTGPYPVRGDLDTTAGSRKQVPHVRGLVGEAARRVAVVRPAVRQQHQQPEDREQGAVPRAPHRLGVGEPDRPHERLRVQDPGQPDRDVLEEVGHLVGRVAEAAVLEVHEPARDAVEEHVGQVAVGEAEHRVRDRHLPVPGRLREPAASRGERRRRLGWYVAR